MPDKRSFLHDQINGYYIFEKMRLSGRVLVKALFPVFANLYYMIPEYIKKLKYYFKAEEQFRKTESEYWLSETKRTRQWLIDHIQEEEVKENDKLQYTLFN